MKRKILLLLILGFILLFFSACKDKTAGENVLRLAMGGRLSGFDPAMAGDSISVAVQSQIYESLFQYSYLKRPLVVEPCLAESMPKISSDNLTYTFRIKKGVFFQDDPCFTNGKGREVTAEDFVYSFKRIADVHTKSSGWWIFNNKIKGLNTFRKKSQMPNFDYSLDVKGLKVLNKYTFQIKLTRPYPQILYILAMPYTAVVPKEAVKMYGEEFINHPVGTGPYKLAKWVRGSKIILVKNPQFRKEFYPDEGENVDRTNGLLDDAGEQLPFIDKVVYNIILEDQPFWLNFMKGTLDFGGIPKDNFNSAITKEHELTPEMKAKGIRIIKRILPDIRYVAFNMEDSILGKNKYLRQAMSLAYNRQRHIDLFANGRAIPANFPFPPVIAGYDKNFVNPYTKFDLKKAKILMEKAGYPEGKGLPVLHYSIGSQDTTTRQASELFQKEMKAIGINVQIEPSTWPQFLKKVSSKSAQLWGIGWAADYPDAENFLQLLYGPNSSPGPNGANYNNPIYNKLYEKISIMQPSVLRTTLYKKMAKIATEDCPWILGTYPISYSLYYKWVKNYKPNSFSRNNIKYLKIDYKLRDNLLNGDKK